jgi:hypothetical protein
LQGLVPEHIRDFFETGAFVDHVRGGGMPEGMCTQPRSIIDASALQGTCGNPTDGSGVAKGQVGCAAVEEDDATGRRGTSPSEVRGERLSDIMDEG